MAKAVAATLTSILEHPSMKQILDRSTDVMTDLVPKTLAQWSYDLFSRKPGPAVTEDGEFQGTDLDLACFLSALADRGAVLNLPTYTSRRASSKREGERVISKDNRHGPITGLTANKETFSFGIRVMDSNVVTTDPVTGKEKVGAPRNFMLVDVTGKWHDGWRSIEFSPSAKENEFLSDKKLWTGHSVVFKNFVHPNRWISFYGQYYFITKALIERLNEQASHCLAETKRLQALGIKFPPGAGPQEWPTSTKVGEEKKIVVSAFEAEIDIPDFTGEFPLYPNTEAGLVEAAALRKKLIYGVIPQLRFATRSVELAFFQNGYEGKTAYAVGKTETLPAWITDAKWERDYVIKGKRSKWNRLVLFQPAPGQVGVSLRYRVWEKTERVADNDD